METCGESRHQRGDGNETKEDVAADEGVQVILLNLDEPIRENVEGDDCASDDR